MDQSYTYFDRDLSWLSFNYRVLQEAKDPSVPLYERINFLSIYSSNLDEFFRVRVATLRTSLKIGKEAFSSDPNLKPEELLQKILETVTAQQNEFGQIITQDILPSLRENNIVLYYGQDPDEKHHHAIRSYFRSKVLTYLQPLILSEKSRKSFLENRALYFLIGLKRKNEENPPIQYAILNIPSDHLPRFYELPSQDGIHYYIFLDDVIRNNLGLIFPGYDIHGCYSIKLNRDAELHIENEHDGDLINKIKKQLQTRDIGVPSRFLYDFNMTDEVLDFLLKELELDQADVVPGGRYHNLNNLNKLPNPHKPKLKDRPLPSISHDVLDQNESLFEAIAEKDYMLHFPYHSYDYVLRFFNEAAIDPYVSEIKLTVYRVAADSFIANALISAVRNGKKVTVFVEVKARFDEQNNLKWAEAMEKEGVKIIFSIPGLKVHAKVALVIRKTPEKRQELAFLGTGNFNEGTAKIYADHGLFTANLELTEELNHLFKYLNKRKEMPPLKHLLISQFNILPRFIELIDDQIRRAKEGKTARMIIKINNLEDKGMIDKLYEAAGAGVEIDLIVRGISCLRPGLYPNIRVRRIVDRFLEHARAFVFFDEQDFQLYMGSADWMKRNLHHRIEVIFPVLDAQLKSEIMHMLQLQLNDNTKAVLLDGEQNNIAVAAEAGASAIRCQEDFYQWVKDRMDEVRTIVEE